VALVDPNRVELYINAFVQVLIDSPENETEFIERIQNVPEVQECHCITGEYGYLLKVRAATPKAFEALLKEKVKSGSGVVRTHTLMVLSSHKDTTELPIGDE
jgi:Lrp/AsnC family leucine-responsive transcriptional regulator